MAKLDYVEEPWDFFLDHSMMVDQDRARVTERIKILYRKIHSAGDSFADTTRFPEGKASLGRTVRNVPTLSD